MTKSEWISAKIAKLINEGEKKDRAIAIAYSMYERGDHMQEGGTRQSAPRYGVESMFPIVRMERATKPEAYGGTGVYQGYNAYYKDPQSPDFNPESDMVFYTEEEIQQKRGMNQPSSMAAGQYDPYINSYFSKTQGQVGKTLPIKQGGGGFYDTYNPYFTTNPGVIPQQPTPNVNLGNRNAFSQPSFNPNPSLGFEQGQKYMGLGVNENYKSQVSPESLTAGQDFKDRNKLPQGVLEGSISQPQQSKQESQQYNDWIKYNILNPYRQGMDLNTSLAYTGQQFGQGNTGRGLLGAGLSALKGARSFMSGYASGKGQQTLEQQMYDRLYNSDESLYNRDVATYQSGGLYYAQEAIVPNELVNKYGYEPTTDYSFPQNEPSPTNGVEQVVAQTQQTPTVEENENFDKNSARDTWAKKTGLPWSEAKRLGYTDGSAKDNMKLLSELNDPRFKVENLRTRPFTAPTPNLDAVGQEYAKAKAAAFAPKKGQTDKAANRGVTAETKAAWDAIPKRNAQPQGEIRQAEEEGILGAVSRYGEYLANPFQTFGEYAKYGKLPAAGFSKHNENAYDIVQGIRNPAYWVNKLSNATDFASQKEYKKAALEAIGALPAAQQVKWMKYLPVLQELPAAGSAARGSKLLEQGKGLVPRQQGGYAEPRKGEFDENQRGSMYHEGGVHIGQEYDLTEEEIHELLSKKAKRNG